MDPNNTLNQRREDRDRIGGDYTRHAEQQVAQAIAILADFQRNFAQMQSAILRHQLDIFTAWARQTEAITQATQETATGQPERGYRQQQGQN